MRKYKDIMSINIGMVTWNRLELTRRTVESLFEKTVGDFTLHVADNASSDGTRAYLEDLAARRDNARLEIAGIALAKDCL